MSEPAAPDNNEQLYRITGRMREILTDQNREAIDIMRVLLVEGRLDWNVAERLIAEPNALTPDRVSAAFEESERAAAQDAPMPVDEDRVQRLEFTHPERAEQFLPAGAALLSDESKRHYAALRQSDDLPAKTTAVWVRRTLRAEGKQQQLDTLLRHYHPEVGDPLAGTVNRFTQEGLRAPQAGGAGVGDGAKDTAGTGTQAARSRDDLSR